jgi:phosphatidylinositol glycan class B
MAMGDNGVALRNRRIWFWVILVVAIVLRVLAFNPYSAHHPDETIQYLEQAHRIVFGYGVVPWEFRYFIRSWFIPLILVPPMQLGEWLDPGGTVYLVLPRAMVAAVNLAPVIAAWFIGKRISTQHAVVAMAVMAIWVESVLFSVQTLSESLAVSCFMAAAALLHSRARLGAIAAAGFLMALAGLMRFQFAPAIAVYGAVVAGKDWRLWKGLLIGGLPVVIGGGLLDLAMGLKPYEWILTNYRMNIVDERMRKIGGIDHWTYFGAIAHYWKWALLIVPFLALSAWRQHRALALAALVNIIVHQLIGHKEYRYLWLSMQIILLLAALGSVDLLRSGRLGRRLEVSDGLGATAALIAAWGLLSLSLAMTPTFRLDWRASGEPSRLAAEALRDPRVCGLAVPRGPYTWFGYALVHVDKPLFLLPADGKRRADEPVPSGAGYNAIIRFAKEAAPPGFGPAMRCTAGPRGHVCLYRREGGCRIDPASRHYLYQATLDRFDM